MTPTNRPSVPTTVVMPRPLRVISWIASPQRGSLGTAGIASPVCMRSPTRKSARQPSAPAGCSAA